jgi:hypothetical protein
VASVVSAPTLCLDVSQLIFVFTIMGTDPDTPLVKLAYLFGGIKALAPFSVLAIASPFGPLISSSERHLI